MAGTITLRNVARFWRPEGAWGHTTALAVPFAVHAACREYRTGGERESGPFLWEWTDRRATEEALSAIWRMTGRWQARRAITMTRKRFDARVLDVVPRMAARLNTMEVRSLGDLGSMGGPRYRRAMVVIHDAVAAISALRGTQVVEPVLGSKVLHHYFPSVVPVFDTALVRHGIMRTSAFRRFVRVDEEGWLLHHDAREAGGSAMLEYHRYIAFAAAEIARAPSFVLRRLRARFGRAFRRLAPTAAVDDVRGVLWHLDAKLAEYCLLGEAVKERLLEPL
jgi:hypothetical protein